ncbi:transport and Golgi organization protein 6 homolog [Trichoplusia ni]|uniref:Transport and Golgi organization protein 6 homolog n=1 Tax=Trichoplusia ni TaxID=7111 RepID=A0A7E5VFI6_TRINI|nr:transport and Golgi organization protein 6 homolog [Trichoplusia ni]
MSVINAVFSRIENLTQTEGQNEFISILKDVVVRENEVISSETYTLLKNYLEKIFCAIDELASELKKDEAILISVKNQKLLRTCFQLITSLGISPSLIPGLGISLSKRCITGAVLTNVSFSDEQKYEMLIDCTDFITRCYEVSNLKSIIITLHLSDYLASLIQLSFAPFKKPGTYNNFTMTPEMYEKLCKDREKYVKVYNHLVTNCFQPLLMKELLVLQSGTNPSPPAFVKRTIAKELSQRLLAPGGLLSLIRCFIESYNIDTGFEWRKIDMICKIVATKHGTMTEDKYLENITSQLNQILSLNNTHYLATVVACVINLYNKYSESQPVLSLLSEIFDAFKYDKLIGTDMPGTILLTPQEVENKINILHACVCITKLEWPINLLTPNLCVLFLIGTKITKNEELKSKVKDILLKSMEKLNKNELHDIVKTFLYGKGVASLRIKVEEFDAGITIKCIADAEDHIKDEAVIYFLQIFRSATENILVTNIFNIALRILMDLNSKRQNKGNRDMLLTEDDPVLLDEVDQQYAIILQLLSEIATTPKVINGIKTNPLIVSEFIEHFISEQNSEINYECVTIALVLLNTILSNEESSADLKRRFDKLVPTLRSIVSSDSSMNSMLCKEALSLITSEGGKKKETACEKAISDTFHDLLPVRANGIIELTKLIDAKDSETISKKHYVFCIFQDHLKDEDSYIYLAAVNGLAALCSHCTEDVLHVLCKEFLQNSLEQDNVETKESQNRAAELRMKIGDIIVKVTRKLGEMAIVHKTILLNTMLCGCRDEDHLIRTSALSNLAEIALILNYKIGTIIYEVLLCIWGIIETDKAVECRRAAVMVISSLIKGLGKETLLQLKEQLLPIYRTLKELYRDHNEDTTVRLHAQIALEELNAVVNQILFPELKMEKQIFILDQPNDIMK